MRSTPIPMAQQETESRGAQPLDLVIRWQNGKRTQEFISDTMLFAWPTMVSQTFA